MPVASEHTTTTPRIHQRYDLRFDKDDVASPPTSIEIRELCEPTRTLHWDNPDKLFFHRLDSQSPRFDSGYSSLGSWDSGRPGEADLESTALVQHTLPDDFPNVDFKEISGLQIFQSMWPQYPLENSSGKDADVDPGWAEYSAPLVQGPSYSARQLDRNSSSSGGIPAAPQSVTANSDAPLDLQDKNIAASPTDTDVPGESGRNLKEAEDATAELDPGGFEVEQKAFSRASVSIQTENDGTSSDLEIVNQFETGRNQVNEWLSSGSFRLSPGFGSEKSDVSLRNLKQVGLATLRIELILPPTDLRADEGDACSIASLDSTMALDAEYDSEELAEGNDRAGKQPSQSSEYGSTSSQGAASAHLTGTGVQGRSGTRKSDEPTDDGEGEGPPRKRGRKGPAPGREKPKSIRFACPFQAYDPIGARHCCQPGLNNLGGGCGSIIRVK